ncbi:MAG: hypothetical protein HRU35_06900 [Rickettsiaceae bacterium]|nr:hypothetical protein [Rickettsiaceae bacterium]
MRGVLIMVKNLYKDLCDAVDSNNDEQFNKLAASYYSDNKKITQEEFVDLIGRSLQHYSKPDSKDLFYLIWNKFSDKIKTISPEQFVELADKSLNIHYKDDVWLSIKGNFTRKLYKKAEYLKFLDLKCFKLIWDRFSCDVEKINEHQAMRLIDRAIKCHDKDVINIVWNKYLPAIEADGYYSKQISLTTVYMLFEVFEVKDKELAHKVWFKFFSKAKTIDGGGFPFITLLDKLISIKEMSAFKFIVKKFADHDIHPNHYYELLEKLIIFSHKGEAIYFLNAFPNIKIPMDKIDGLIRISMGDEVEGLTKELFQAYGKENFVDLFTSFLKKYEAKSIFDINRHDYSRWNKKNEKLLKFLWSEYVDEVNISNKHVLGHMLNLAILNKESCKNNFNI